MNISKDEVLVEPDTVTTKKLYKKTSNNLCTIWRRSKLRPEPIIGPMGIPSLSHCLYFPISPENFV